MKSNCNFLVEQDLVSVIIACRNAERYIDKCIQSLIESTYSNFEIVICDDASTDATWSILNKWALRDSRIVLLRNSENKYQASARNSCFDVARGSYFMIHDIDDLSTPNRIDVLLSSLKDNNVDFVSSAMAIIGDDGHIDFNHIMRHKKSFPTAYDFLWNPPFNHPATLFKSSVIRKINGYRVSEETRRSEDYDLFMRLYALGYKGMNVGEVLYFYLLDASNYKRRTFSSRLDECIVRYKGFKLLNILYIGFLFVFKPIAAHFYTKSYIFIKYKGF